MSKKKLRDLTPLPEGQNPNAHSPRGMEALEESIRLVGWLGAATLDSGDNVLDGNARHEKADILEQDPLIIDSDGSRPIYIRRTDIEPDSEKAHQATILANRVAELNYTPNAEVIARLLAQDIKSGAKMAGNAQFFKPLEIQTIMLAAQQNYSPQTPEELWKGMPEFEQEEIAYRTIHIHFRNEEDVQQFAQLIQQIITESTRYLWYPIQEKRNLTQTRYITNES